MKLGQCYIRYIHLLSQRCQRNETYSTMVTEAKVITNHVDAYGEWKGNNQKTDRLPFARAYVLTFQCWNFSPRKCMYVYQPPLLLLSRSFNNNNNINHQEHHLATTAASRTSDILLKPKHSHATKASHILPKTLSYQLRYTFQQHHQHAKSPHPQPRPHQRIGSSTISPRSPQNLAKKLSSSAICDECTIRECGAGIPASRTRGKFV